MLPGRFRKKLLSHFNCDENATVGSVEIGIYGRNSTWKQLIVVNLSPLGDHS